MAQNNVGTDSMIDLVLRFVFSYLDLFRFSVFEIRLFLVVEHELIRR